MKIFLAISLSVALNASELEWVNSTVEAIQLQRKGIDSFSSIKNPFIYFLKNGSTHKKMIRYNKQKKRIGFELQAIINNSALINNRWYNINNIIQGYKIKSIKKTSVLLHKNTRYIKLKTNFKPKIKFRIIKDDF